MLSNLVETLRNSMGFEPTLVDAVLLIFHKILQAPPLCQTQAWVWQVFSLVSVIASAETSRWFNLRKNNGGCHSSEKTPGRSLLALLYCWELGGITPLLFTRRMEKAWG